MANETQVASELQRIVLARLRSGTLTLPVLPVAASQALTLLRDPDVSFRAVAAALDRDPMLAVQALRAANAAANAGAAVCTLEQALMRLGLARMRTFLLETCARKLFLSRDTRIQRATEGLWEHSIAVAMLARDLAALAGADADVAYVAGLLHDIGKPVVAAYLLETEKLAATRSVRWIKPDAWVSVIDDVSPRVTEAIAASWDLPEPVSACLRTLADYDAANRQSPANYVRFANAVAQREGIDVGAVDTDAASALVMVGRSLLGIDDEVVGRMTADLRERAHRRITKAGD